MHFFELEIFCNGTKTKSYKGDKGEIQRIEKSFGLMPEKYFLSQPDLVEMSKTYVKHTPSEELYLIPAYFDYRVKKSKITASKTKEVYDIQLPWILTRRLDGVLTMSCCFTTQSIEIKE